MVNENQDLKKEFEPHAISDYGIYQMHFIKTNKKNYSLVGQTTTNSPLFTHFDIYDRSGYSANEKEASIVYKNMSMLSMIGFLESYDWLFQNSNNNEVFNDELFKNIYGEDINELVQENYRFRLLLEKLISEKDKLVKKDELDANNMSGVKDAFDLFWTEYESRIQTLFKFREFLWEEDLNVAVQETNLENIYHEANTMYKLFTETLSTKQVLTGNIYDLIQILEDIGRVRIGDGDALELTPFQRFSKQFFKVGFLVLFWGILPLGLICMLFGICSSIIPLFAFAGGLFFYSADKAEIRARRIKMNKRFKAVQKERLRVHPLIRGKYSNAYKILKELEQESMEDSYQFVGTPLILLRMLVIPSIFALILGLALLSDDGEDAKYGSMWMNIAIILILLRIFLPQTKLGNTRFQLTPEGLKVGKRVVFPIEDFLKLTINKRGNVLTVDNFNVDAQKYKLKKSNKKEIKNEIEVWSDKYNVLFVDKNNS